MSQTHLGKWEVCLEEAPQSGPNTHNPVVMSGDFSGIVGTT